MPTYKPKIENVPFKLKKRIMQLYGRGFTQMQIASLVGRSQDHVRAVVNHYLRTRNNNWKVSERFERLVVKMYTQTRCGCKKIASYFGVNEQLICRILKRNNVTKRAPTEYRKYTLDESFFEVIDTEEKAYWLGFIAADGCVSNDRQLLIRLHEKDIEHLEKFQKAVKTDTPIKKQRDLMYGITISSKKMCEDLSKYVIVPNKTFDATIPNIPYELIRHFIRGVFDGDGSFHINFEKCRCNFNICGNYKMLSSIQKYMMDELSLRQVKIHPTKSIYNLTYGGLIQVYKIGTWLYKDAIVYLQRKKDLFDKIEAEYKSRELQEAYVKKYIHRHS